MNTPVAKPARKRGRPIGTHAAPTVKPKGRTVKSACGKFTISTYYTPNTTKNGTTTYHKHTQTRPLKKAMYPDGIVRRPNRKKTNTPNKRKIQKRKLVNDLKTQILLSDDIDIEGLKTMYTLLNIPLPVLTVC